MENKKNYHSDLKAKTIMQTKLTAGQKIIFGIPYFESSLYHHAEIIELKNENVVVIYSNRVETINGFVTITHKTEIPIEYIIQN